MAKLRTAEEYSTLAAQARAGAWTARNLDERAAFLRAEFNCELMARSMENLRKLRDELNDLDVPRE